MLNNDFVSTSPHFGLVEIYRSQEATVVHKATAHYVAWRGHKDDDPTRFVLVEIYHSQDVNLHT